MNNSKKPIFSYTNIDSIVKLWISLNRAHDSFMSEHDLDQSKDEDRKQLFRHLELFLTNNKIKRSVTSMLCEEIGLGCQLRWCIIFALSIERGMGEKFSSALQGKLPKDFFQLGTLNGDSMKRYYF